MRYIYESHIGGIYFDNENKSASERYCETCGDYDWCLGKVETLEACWEVIKDNCDINGSGGWCLQYIYPILVSEFLLDDEVPYASYDEKSQGFCSLSDDEIIKRIQNFIKQDS